MTVAVIGSMGVVGQAQVELFSSGGGNVVTYDVRDTGDYPERAIARSQFAVVAVGTPPGPGGHADLTAVRAALKQLPEGLPVMVRSTLPPGTSRELRMSRHPGLYAHVPEFLHERKGGRWPKSGDVPFMLLGADSAAALRFFHPMLARYYQGTIHECSGTEAELAKYTANLAWANRVTFVNEMANICATFGVKWGEVRALWLTDSRVTSAYTKMKGFEPGFGGACWPKDLAALIAASSDAGYEPEFLRAIQEANDRFRGE